MPDMSEPDPLRPPAEPPPAEPPVAAPRAGPAPQRATSSARTLGLVAAGVVIALLAGVVGGLVGGRIGRRTPAPVATASGCAAASVAEDVLPAVVTLQVSGAASGTGSGEILRADGYVLTNDHVISPAGPTGSIDVLLSGGQREPGVLVGRAPLLDLAVVKLTGAGQLPTIRIGDSGGLRVGQPVVALGAPLGLSGTVTTGIVSALGRDVTLPISAGQTAFLVEAIQTDAAINPGNSGGPLVDCAGRLVGINTAGAVVPGAAGQSVGNVGIGFAIPVELAGRVADQIIATGAFTPAYLGLSAAPVPAAMAERFGAPAGLYVQSVEVQSPAQRAGLAAGDVITTIDGQPADSVDALFKVVLTRNPGDQVQLGYQRDGAERSVTVTLATPPG